MESTPTHDGDKTTVHCNWTKDPTKEIKTEIDPLEPMPGEATNHPTKSHLNKAKDAMFIKGTILPTDSY